MATRQDTLESIGATAALLNQGGGNNPLVNQLIELQLKRLQREEQEREAEVEAKRQAELNKQRIRVADAQREEAQRSAIRENQKYCPHVMSNRATLVRGQGLGGGKVKLFCQSCLKSYDSMEDVPPHLRPPLEQFGGPKY